MDEDADFDTTVDLDLRNGTLVQPVQVDAGNGARELLDSQTTASVTEVVNFGDNDRLSLLDVTDRNGDGTISLADVDFRVVDGDAEIELDDGAGTLSRIVLRNVGGDALSLDAFNAIPNLGPVRLGTDQFLPAANAFLTAGSGLSVADNVRVFGRGNSEEQLFIASGARDVRTDANIDAVDLDLDFAAVDFAVTNNGLRLSTGDETVVTIPSLNQPTDLRLADGNATITQTGATAFRLDGGDAGSATIDAGGGDVSGLDLGAETAAPPSAGGAALAASVFLNGGESLTVFDPVRIFGATSGNETVVLSEDATGVRMDANIERLEVPRAFDELDFAVTGDGLEIAAGDTTVATLPSLNQPAAVLFADGDATLTQIGAQSFEIAGGDGGTATIDTTGRSGDIDLGAATAEPVTAVGVAADSPALAEGVG